MKAHARRLNLVGKRFGRLTAVTLSPERFGPRKRTAWVCRCDCGATTIVKTSDLTTGNTRSCGCLARDLLSARKQTHGFTRGDRKPRLYRIWQNMRQRCYDPNFTNAHRWGGRGIKVCDEWNDFEAFRTWALANGYRPNLSIDRIDNDGGYAPSNCRWATPVEQARNTSQTRFITYDGVTKPAAEWAEEVGLTPKTLTQRIDKYGWTPAEAITTPRYGARGSRNHEQR